MPCSALIHRIMKRNAIYILAMVLMIKKIGYLEDKRTVEA